MLPTASFDFVLGSAPSSLSIWRSGYRVTVLIGMDYVGCSMDCLGCGIMFGVVARKIMISGKRHRASMVTLNTRKADFSREILILECLAHSVEDHVFAGSCIDATKAAASFEGFNHGHRVLQKRMKALRDRFTIVV